MTEYGCGHKSEFIVMDSNPLSMSAWLVWKDGVGFDGDKSQCWKCYCEEMDEKARKMRKGL